MIAVILSVLLAQVSTPSPTPAPGVPPGWTAQPLDPNEVFSFSRAEKDGTTSYLKVFRQLCDCQPGSYIDEVQTAITNQGASTKRDSLTVCGEPALRLIGTGIASEVKRNIETIAFRSGKAFVSMNYFFAENTPDPEAEAALRSLCPPVSPAS